ncbi:hypothetical protein TNCV_3684171 [Trichonephila clavipes]|uniref:Uncharacterized protein n=1 Tax=Trichonephila clavipes TaxID=2585209 RepID=A0A8X6RJK6_TRICX|nr:hypothetical protein TNCV_3684171 [Trichonephila clavipes]
MSTPGFKEIEHKATAVTTGDGSRNFEPWSSDEDDTSAGIVVSNLPHHSNGKASSLKRFNVHPPRRRVFSSTKFRIHDSTLIEW